MILWLYNVVQPLTAAAGQRVATVSMPHGSKLGICLYLQDSISDACSKALLTRAVRQLHEA